MIVDGLECAMKTGKDSAPSAALITFLSALSLAARPSNGVSFLRDLMATGEQPVPILRTVKEKSWGGRSLPMKRVSVNGQPRSNELIVPFKWKLYSRKLRTLLESENLHLPSFLTFLSSRDIYVWKKYAL